MSFEERIKIFKRAMARHGLFGCSWLINKLSFSTVRRISHVLIAIGYRFAIKQRRIAQESLNIALGQDKDERAVKKIMRDCFENLGWGMIELIYFMEHPAMIRRNVIFEGKEHLDEALKAGQGVIAVSAHFGSFPMMLLRCVQEGYKTNAIIRPTRDKEVEEYFLEQRTRLGLKTVYSVPRKECVDASLKALRNNEILFIPLDQNFGRGGGVFVDFFGRKAATATGPVVFALRTKAPILPMFIIRQADDTHKIMIEPPLVLEEREDDKETILVNTAKITQVIERYIRQFPEEWGWMHRRWKTQPAEQEHKSISA